MEHVQLSFDRIAKELGFKLDASQALILAGTVAADVNVISALVAAAEVAAVCELILENTDNMSALSQDRFEDMFKRSQASIALFKDKYKVSLVSVSPNGHIVQTHSNGNGKPKITHIEPSQSFKTHASNNSGKEYRRLTDAEETALEELLTNLDTSGGIAAALQEVAAACHVSYSTVQRRYYALRGS